MVRNICLYSSSSDAVREPFKTVARRLGAVIGERGDILVFGGCDIGLMGIAAHAVKEAGGKVISIIPAKLEEKGLGFKGADETLVTDDLRERKALMDEKADAFAALPGGLGTLDEVMEILSLKYLKYHNRPIVLLNEEGYYRTLLDFMDKMYAEKFAKPSVGALFHVIDAVDEFYPYLDAYKPPRIEDKWF